MTTGLFVFALVVVVVAVDVLFLRHLFWLRLAVNIGIVVLFAAVFLRFRTRRSEESRRRAGSPES